MKTITCSCNGRTDNPLNHYETCPDPPMPLPWIRSILNGTLGDERHSGGKITATRLLTCARETLIQDFLPHTIDPVKMSSLHEGTTWHQEMARNAEPGTYQEVSIPPEGVEPPILFGVPVRGQIDHLTADFGEIHDYKKHSEGAQAFAVKSGGKKDDALQLNIYRILIAKSVMQVPPESYRPKMIVWHSAMTSKRGPKAHYRTEAPYMGEEEIGLTRPKDGHATVQEIAATYKAILLAMRNGMPPEKAIAAAPLHGLEMMRGEKCLSYCLVADICARLQGVARI